MADGGIIQEVFAALRERQVFLAAQHVSEDAVGEGNLAGSGASGQFDGLIDNGVGGNFVRKKI